MTETPADSFPWHFLGDRDYRECWKTATEAGESPGVISGGHATATMVMNHSDVCGYEVCGGYSLLREIASQIDPNRPETAIFRIESSGWHEPIESAMFVGVSAGYTELTKAFFVVVKDEE